MSVRVRSLSQLYPGAATGSEGIFVHERLRHLPEPYAPAVWRVRPFFPLRRGVRPPARETVDGVAVEDVPFLYLPGVLKGRDGHWLLRALVRRDLGEAALLDAHFGYPAGWAATRLARRAGLPCVVTFRGTEVPYSRHRARRARLAECAAAADRIVAVSGSLAELAIALGTPPERVRVIGNGVDTGLFRPGGRGMARSASGLPSDRRVLLTVGGLTERKGVRRVIEVLPELVGRHADLLYVVVGGGGPEGDEGPLVRRLVRELGLGDHVRLEGPRPREALPDYYRAADAFVLASRNEGWANVLNEALACGVPVVATDVGGNREVLGGGRHGTLVPFGDRSALRAAIDAVLSGEVRTEPGPVRSWEEVGRDAARVFDELL